MDQHAVPILKALAERPRFMGVERELGILILTVTCCLVLGLREVQAVLAGVLLFWIGAAITSYDPDLLRVLKRLRRQADIYLPY